MIDIDTFVTEMQLLQTRFGHARTMPAEALARYRAYLSARMTTEQFVQAAQIVFDEYDHWPSPRSFAEAVIGNVEVEAGELWADLLTLATRGDGDAVTPSMLATMRSIGATFRDISTANEYQLAALSKAFRAAYARNVKEQEQAQLEQVKLIETKWKGS